METEAQRIERETNERVDRKLQENADRLKKRYSNPPLDLRVRLDYLRKQALRSGDE